MSEAGSSTSSKAYSGAIGQFSEVVCDRNSMHTHVIERALSVGQGPSVEGGELPSRRSSVRFGERYCEAESR